MLDRDQANDIFDKLRRLSQADEIELLISGGHSALTRFANNTIHQNVAEEEYHISVRSAFGNRTARASTNKHDDESLRRVVQSSEMLAQVQHSDPDLLPMPTPQEVAAANVDSADGGVNRYCEATVRLTPQDRAQGVATMVEVAKKHNLTAAGIFSSAEIVEGIFNSKGVSHWYEQTLAEVSVEHARQLFVGMAEGKLARRSGTRPRAHGRSCCCESHRVEESSGLAAGEIHGHP